MKAVIVEIRGETAAALGRDGTVFKVKNRAYAVGQTIDVRRGVRSIRRQIAVLAAAAAAVFLIVGAGIFTYAAPYSMVSLDVNPSLQYTLNRLGLVLSVEAVNGDGDEILAEVGALSNRSIEDAIVITVRQITEDGYFDGDEPGGIVIAASSRDEGEARRLAENVRETAISVTRESEKDVVVAALTVDQDQVEQAKELGVSPGKLTLVEQLKDTASNPEDIDVMEWLEKPVKDIMEQTASQLPPAEGASSGSSPSAGESGGASSGGSSASSGEASSGSVPSEQAPSSADGPSEWDSGYRQPSSSSSAGQPIPRPPRSEKPKDDPESEPASEPEQGPQSEEGGSAMEPASSGTPGEAEEPVSSGGVSSGGTSHEAPSESESLPPVSSEPEDDKASSSASSRKASSKSYGHKLPMAGVDSRPWWEQIP